MRPEASRCACPCLFLQAMPLRSRVEPAEGGPDPECLMAVGPCCAPEGEQALALEVRRGHLPKARDGGEGQLSLDAEERERKGPADDLRHEIVEEMELQRP